MEPLRVFTNPKKCIQRLGFLKPLVWRASLSSTNSVSSLGNELISNLSRKVDVPLTPSIKEYVKNVLKAPIYRKLREMVADDRCETTLVGVEVQDYFLSDEGIPSKTGKLVPDDHDKYPYLALNLGLIRKTNCSLLGRGKSFLTLVPEDEIKAFSRPSESSHNRINPLKLSFSQKILLTFSLIECDGDVLKPLYTKLLDLPDLFDDFSAGSLLPEIFKEIVKKNINAPSNYKDRINKLVSISESIEKNMKAKSGSSKNSLFHNITPRLEPFVDIGLLQKDNSYSYKYRVSQSGKSFFYSLANSESIKDFLEKHFFRSIATSGIDERNFQPEDDSKNILRFVTRSYDKLKDPFGYAPIDEVFLLAGILCLEENSTYFEISDCRDVVMNIRKKYPYEFRFNVNREGKISSIKIDRAVLGKIGL